MGFTFNWEINLGNLLSALAVLLTIWGFARQWREKIEEAITILGDRIATVHLEAIGEVRRMGEKVARIEGLLNGERRRDASGD